MSRRARHARAVSRRSLSITLVIALALSMFVGVVFLSGAQNPNKVTELNRSVVVQEINLLPTDPNVDGSRTTLYAGTNSKESGKYSAINVNKDGSVDFTITQQNTHNQTSTNDTSFVEAFTLVQQQINLATNPWLMVRWSGSGRCNGRIYFTVTYDGVEYGNKSKSYNSSTYSDSSGVVQLDLKTKTQQELISSGVCFQLPLSNIINNNNAGYSYVNQTQTDFNAGTVADYSIDLYKYISEQVDKGQMSSLSAHWPTGEQWLDAAKFHVTFYMSAQIIASESNQSLTAGTYIHWEKFAVGREVMNRPASLLPRSAEFMNITAGGTATDDGRVAKLDDGSVTFSNTGNSDVVFEWNLRRYFNSTELEALHINASYTGENAKNFKLQTWFGGTTTYKYKSGDTWADAKTYSYRGTETELVSFVSGNNKKYAKTAHITDTACEAVINFNDYLRWIPDDTDVYPEAYKTFYPEDSLIFVDNLKLTLPAGCKITFAQLEFQVENADIPATKADTVYPWVSEEAPNGLPPVGTPAYSTALNGASGTSYDWAADATEAPIVKSKVDLLAMKTYSWNDWSETALSTSDNSKVGVEYIRRTDGSSEYSSILKDADGNVLEAPNKNSYYTLMRFGPSDDYSRNYYTYLDVKDTPYLYYSYEIVDETPEDDVTPQAGFYFHFQNAGRDKYTDYKNNNEVKYAYQYYLDHSGIALNECSSMFNLAYIGSATDITAYEYGAKAILSTTTARTGCIDISSLWTDGVSTTQTNGQYLKLETMRIYLAPGTKIKINYLFVGGESLNRSVIDSGTLPREGGQSFPWAVSKADFDKWTDPDSADKQFTFANKVDLLKDIQDRAVVNNRTEAFPGAAVDSETGAVTVEVTNNAAGTDVNTGFLQTAGFGFDHIWQMQIAANGDLSSMRYLNYSVSAPAGMRWSIMFCESSDSASDQRAIMTWCDADARYNDNDIYTAAPAGKTYFRMATAQGYTFSDANGKPEYDSWWKDHNNTSWRIYSIPGSQTGCLDMRQVDAEFEWDNIVSIYLVAYQDPNLVLEEDEAATVTFNYLYLTSTPIKATAEIGRPAVTPGTIYNWGNTKVTRPSLGNAYTFLYRDKTPWDTSDAFNYTIDGLAPGKAVDLNEFPYLYYSYRLVEKLSDGTTRIAEIPSTDSLVSMWIIENSDSQGTVSLKRNTAGGDSNGSHAIGATGGTNTGYGKPSFIRQKDNNTAGANYTKVPYYGYAAETGCIDLKAYSIDDDNIYQVRFVVNNSLCKTEKYELIVDYLYLGTAPTSTAPSFEQSYTPLNLTKAPTPSDYQVPVDGTTAVEIDLDKTPYLFYCEEYATGDIGSFALSTSYSFEDADGAVKNGTPTFCRDASRTDGALISAGTPVESQYMLQSESGCIDVRQWYINQGYFEEDDPKVITISSVSYYGDPHTTHYMYFGAKADKTIDMIPSEAAGRLDNGLPTRTWVVPDKPANYAELMTSDGEWDAYNEDTNVSGTLPVTQVKYKDDVTKDDYNDLWIKSDAWSQIYLRYGSIITQGNGGTFAYSTTGNNQMSGLMIDLNETPYLHYSLEQADTSRTVMLLQTTNNTSNSALNGQPANKTRPWLSAYYPVSPAGQLTSVLASTNIMAYYKETHEDDMATLCSVYGDHGGVIDLRSWYTQTNGYSNVVSLDSIRFYTYAAEGSSTATDLKINYLYLSSSASAAYAVTFNKNDGSNNAYTQYVIQNANEQYVSDAAVEDSLKKRDGYTFLGWYTDPSCESYFDIQNTVLTGNLHLYARWIKNDCIMTGSEINILENMDFANRVVESGSGDAALDNEKLSISSTGDLKVRFPVGKAYDVEAFRALFMGFDVDKTCQGFDIILDAKCASSYEYSLVQDIFHADFLTANNNLTAAPYDRETAFYTYLGINNDLPTRENTGNLIEINAVTLVVPEGVSVELRYLKAAKEMSLQGKSDARAPAATNSFDLLANTKNDVNFVSKSDNVVYTKLAATSKTYLNKEYTQAAIDAVNTGHVHLGGLYDFTVDMTDSSTKNPGRYLYFSIDQPEDSYITFALYASFSGMVEGETANVIDKEVHDVYTQKAVSYYSQAAGGLVAKDYGIATEDFLPVDTAYVNGNLVGKIDLYAWYEDALDPYRSNNRIEAVELLGVRFFTSSKSTDANINYFFIGDDETGASKGEFDVFAESSYLKGQSSQANYEEYRHTISKKAHQGETLYVTLDELTGIADKIRLDDPSKKFVGWVFRDIAIDSLANDLWYAGGADSFDAAKDIVKANTYTDAELQRFVVYWNPNATNGNMYHPDDNPDGAWYVMNRTATYKKSDESEGVPYSTIDQRIKADDLLAAFGTDVKSVFYTFSTRYGNTQVILPLFEEYTPSIAVTTEGTGSVTLTADGQTSVGENAWTVPYGSDAVLRASGDNFAGWYDESGVLVSDSRDCHLVATDDTVLTARFGGTAPSEDALVYPLGRGSTIVWLQSTDGKVAGSDFKLMSVNGETQTGWLHAVRSNIDDTTGNKEIVCYWNLSDSQMLKAVAPEDYHWEHLLQDGTTVRASSGNIYTFVASTNIRLLCVADTDAATSAVIMDEYAFDDNRHDTDLRFTGQVVCGEGERILTCGITFVKHRNHGEIPSIGCAFSETVTANAWNSTTGQFTVEFDLVNKVPCVVRGYAVVEKADGTKAIVYSDCTAEVF